ncbi:MAG: DUF4760 domain-containing protein [Psychrosphaera sp.]|nr:DUF4760 domain-containing protein [Psychrosphaera sp.]
MNSTSFRSHFTIWYIISAVIGASIFFIAIVLDAAGFERIKLIYPIFWLLSAMFILIGFVPPLYQMGIEKNAFNAQLKFGLIFICLTIVCCSISTYRLNSLATGPVILMVSVVSIMTGILGWVVHAQLSARLHRKTHTLNMLMQSRLSTEYQQQLRNLYNVYNSSTIILKSDITDFHDKPFNYKNDNLNTNADLSNDANPSNEHKEKAKALGAVRYLLNYFEFVAVGIAENDLDEDLLYLCISGIVLGLHHNAKDYILISQGKVGQSGVFKNLDALVQYWKKRRLEDDS